MRVLAVIAHPDDEALGCGGTLAKMSDAGHQVSVLLPTKRVDPRGRETWPDLLEAFARSCAVLGARSVVLEAPHDENEGEAGLHRLHDSILPWVEDADFVLTHWTGDTNQAHRSVSRAVEIATRPFRRRRDVSLFEIPTSTEQGFAGAGTPPFSPNEYVLLNAEQARRKGEAFEHYSGEFAPGRTPDDIERRLRLRGAEVGAEFAEAFVATRLFR